VTARDDDLREWAAAFALGALPPAEARELEAALAASPEVRADLAAYREVAALLPLAADAPAPDPRLRGRVLARATGRIKRQPRLGRRKGDRWLRLALAASVALAAVATALAAAFALARRELAARAVEVEARLEAVSSRLPVQDSLVDALLAPGVELHRFTAAGDSTSSLRLFWNREQRMAILHATGLPRLTGGRVYQLWLVPVGGVPVPSSTFRPDAGGAALVRGIPVPADGAAPYESFTVTDEPAGGSRVPSTTPRFVATLPS
jgi:anti-sigma-K factor RskA